MQTTQRMQPMQPAPAGAEILDWARELYEQVVDRKDADGFAAAFTTDAWLRFASSPPVVGRDAIRAAIAHFFTTFQALRHEPVASWVVDETLILEARVTYTRHDGRLVTIPAVTIFRLVHPGIAVRGEPVVDQCRIYVDLAPLYAPAADGAA